MHPSWWPKILALRLVPRILITSHLLLKRKIVQLSEFGAQISSDVQSSRQGTLSKSFENWASIYSNHPSSSYEEKLDARVWYKWVKSGICVSFWVECDQWFWAAAGYQKASQGSHPFHMSGKCLDSLWSHAQWVL